MTNGLGPHDPGAVDQLDELPVLDPSTAYRVTDRVVRPPMSFWDRSKLLILLFALWWILLWAALSNNPIEPFSAAVGNELKALWWIEALFGIEVVRQIHYLISERSAGWHHFWADRVFGGWSRATHRINDWNRYRIGRALKVLFFLAILAVILAAFFHTSPLVSLFQVPAAFISALPELLQILLYVGILLLQFVALFWFLSRGGVDTYFPGDVKTRFTDVWGQDSVLEKVKENIIYLKDPDLIESRGGYVPGGILLWGPPGTGKTLIAEAVAGETHNPFVFVDPGAFTNMFMGVGILKVKSLFRKLRKLALRYGGVVVFFDEADSLGNRGSLVPRGVFGPSAGAAPLPWQHAGCRGGSYMDPAIHSQMATEMHRLDPPDSGPVRRNGMMAGMMGGGGMGTLQSLLSEISGLKKPRGIVNRLVRRTLGFPPKPPPKYRILVMMATNMPESLDEALLRPGRIDRIYKVGYPSKAGRIRTYQGYFSKVKHELTPENIDRLATVTPYATGATIKDLVNESLINSIRQERESITWGDVLKAKQLKLLGPPDDVEYIERERHAVAIHEASHAVAAAVVSREFVIDVATIEKNSDTLGMVMQVRAEDSFTRWRTDYEGQVMVSLASLAGEKMFFGGDNSSGLHSDLENATRIAVFMEGYWGMGKTVASHGITREAGVGGGDTRRDRRDRETQMLSGGLGGRIEAKLEELLLRTNELLSQYRLEVLGVAHALEQFKTITGEDVLAIMNGTQGPLIDGARYRTDEFKEIVESYHARMVEAHTSRVPLHVEFPVLPVGVRDPEEVTVFADHGTIDPTH